MPPMISLNGWSYEMLVKIKKFRLDVKMCNRTNKKNPKKPICLACRLFFRLDSGAARSNNLKLRDGSRMGFVLCSRKAHIMIIAKRAFCVCLFMLKSIDLLLVEHSVRWINIWMMPEFQRIWPYECFFFTVCWFVCVLLFYVSVHILRVASLESKLYSTDGFC